MEKTCENCEYFVRTSSDTAEYVHGKCMNPETCAVDQKDNEHGLLQWKSGTCIDFKPKQMQR